MSQVKDMPSKKQVIKTYVSDEEYKQIRETAQQCSLSLSAFAKAVCLGHEIKSRTDQQARRELLKLNADQGRLGGLLKMWILTMTSIAQMLKLCWKTFVGFRKK
ncbi:plasmid mobilization protein [Maridesulfovibrio sp.]|uniref:plasmid mobilization protein n=1 Tax=Maridesulfovibrio sp. TaxID=2795000 RepID=UPI003AFFC99C